DAVDADAKTFEGGEKEELVLEDRTTYSAAILFQKGRRHAVGKEIRGIGHLRIAVERIGRTVQPVRAGFDTDVDDRSVPPAIFRWGVLLRIEFLYGIQRQHVRRISAGAFTASVDEVIAGRHIELRNTFDQQNVRSQTPAVAAGRSRTSS